MTDEIILKIPFKRAMHKTDKGWSGTARFKMSDSAVEIKDGDKIIGHVNGCLGAITEIYLQEDINETMYVAGPVVFWNAYCDAINRSDLKHE